MGKKTPEQKLNKLHELLADTFLQQLASGEYEAKDISNMLKFLKDSGITCDGDLGASLQEAFAAKLRAPSTQDELNEVRDDLFN